jgi:putative ABC transport system permease protein
MLLKLVLRNLRGKLAQTALTALATALCVFAFVVLRSVCDAWGRTGTGSRVNVVVTRHALSLLGQFPVRHVETVRQLPFVDSVMPLRWFGSQSPSKPETSIAFEAVDPAALLRVWGPDMALSEGAAARWPAARDGLLCGEALMESEGWKEGAQVAVASGLFPSPKGAWTFQIAGTFRSPNKALETNQCFFHYAYLNEGSAPERRDLTQALVVRLKDGASTADAARRIDDQMRAAGVRTLTEDSRTAAKNAIGMLESVVSAFDVLSLLLAGTVMLLVGTAISLSIRERTGEFGVLRAVGFGAPFVARLVLLEAVTLALLGALPGFAAAALLVQGVLKPGIDAEMASTFPGFGVTPGLAATTFLGAGAVGVLAGLPTLASVLRVRVVDAIRFVG